MASSSSSSSKYEVFLSFRGEDTRENFTSFLFDALCRKNIKTFIDEDLTRGGEISPALLSTIEGSMISVIIFSKDYAASKWCLDELVKILECKDINGQIVIPIFFHVHPSHVRHQTGSFGKAFGENEKKFRKKTPEKVQKWRDALEKASSLSGFESTKIRPEAKLVDVIVKDILKKLEKLTVTHDLKGLIGINSRIERVRSLLCIGLSDFRIVGIWGMGGIGKTTIAEALFNQISENFDGKFFMANVRDKSKKDGGLEHLQKEIISHLLEENLEMGGPNIPEYSKERLRRMKVFIVLDDVNKFGQLEYLAGGLDRFGQGSRIIVTTRDKQVLDKYGVNLIYQVQELNHQEALTHFCNFAFRQNHPPEDLVMLSEKAVDYAKGNPLAIKVLGSFLYPKSKSDWESALDHFKQIPDPDIYDVLRISYDELNWKMKNIFLDIACFFNGDDKNFVTAIFSDCYSIDCGLDVLVDKSLLSISLFNRLQMHDLLQEMGREIVHQESEEEPGKRSRLWYHKDILHVLNKNKGSDSVKGIFLDLSKIQYIKLGSNAFANMSTLRLLKFYMPKQLDVLDTKFEVDLFQGLEYLSDELRYLHWHGYPFRMLPRNFNPENLIELSFPYGKVEQLWEGKKEACKLKSIDLHHSQYLTKIPDPSEAPNLERVNLLNCMKLPCIPSSIQNFNLLGILCLEGCESLTCFPTNIHFKSKITIDLSFCVNFTEFPQISGKIMGLDLCGTAIEEVPSSIESLTDLENLDLSFCKRLKILSTSICKLKSLSELHLNYCRKFEHFPEILEKMERLEYIDLESSAIKELPSSIENVAGLQTLSLTGCSKLDSLPENMRNLKSLNVINGKGSAISQLPSSFSEVNQLKELLFSGCKGLVLPSLSGLSSLKKLELDDCDIMEIPEDIGCLSSLESLNLKGNNFESLPTSIKQLSRMKKLILSNCKMLQSLPELPLCLFCLEATNCNRLQSLPELSSGLEELDASLLEKLSQQSYDDYVISTELDFSNCRKFNENTNNIILADSHLKQWMTIATLRRFYEKEIFVPYGVSICLPGSGIPDWFSNQSSGSSIKIQLPQLCCKRNLFIGFALCAVIAFEELFYVDDDFVVGLFHADEDFEVVCDYKFETKKVDRHFVFKTIKNYTFEDYFNYVSNHVYLGFDDPRLIVGISGGEHTAVSFNFSINPSYAFGWPKVKCCGVCPIYAHGTENKPYAFTMKMLPPSEEECRELHNEIHDGASTSGTTTELGSSGRSDEEESSAPYQQNSFLSQIFRCLGLDCTCL